MAQGAVSRSPLEISEPFVGVMVGERLASLAQELVEHVFEAFHELDVEAVQIAAELALALQLIASVARELHPEPTKIPGSVKPELDEELCRRLGTAHVLLVLSFFFCVLKLELGTDNLAHGALDSDMLLFHVLTLRSIERSFI